MWKVFFCFLLFLVVAEGFVAPTTCSNSQTTRLFASGRLAQKGDWSAYLDSENTGQVYYFNRKTGESVWEAPSGFPAIVLNDETRRVATQKQEEYYQEKKKKEEEGGGGGGLFSFLGRDDKKEEVVVEEISSPEATTSKPWFSGLFEKEEEKEVAAVVVEDTSNVLTPDQPSFSVKGIFGSARASQEKQEETSDATGSFSLKGLFPKQDKVSQQQSVVDDAPVKDSVQVAETSKSEAGFSLKGLGFGGSKDDQTTKQTVEPAKTQDDNTEEESRFSLKGLFSRSETSKDEDTTLPENKKEDKKIPSKKMAKAMSITTAAGDAAAPKQGGISLRKLFAKSAETVTNEDKASKKKKEQKKVVKQPVAKVEAAPKKVQQPAVETATATPIVMDMASCVLPHPEKVKWGGEDAVLTKGRNFGVFDGVSGADKLGGVPLYSKTLARELKTMVASEAMSMTEMTTKLGEAAKFANSGATGASTAIVGSLSKEGNLSVLNLGDSGCVVIRDGEIVAKSREIVHFFDCPYQLSEDSPDKPRDGTRLQTQIRKGDIVLMGSDGVFDNLSDQALLDTVLTNKKNDAGTLAKRVADQSRKVSLDKTSDTPYAKMAKQKGMSNYADGVGGKVDDISCVVVCCK